MELYNINTEYPVVGACESGIGGRSENQDSYGYQDTPFGLLLTVCDGMGGGPAGKTASSLAVNEIIAGVMEASEESAPMEVVENAIRRANGALLKAVEEKPQLQGMGTTCTVLLINKVSAIIAHVGDSRVYQLRGHHKLFRTFDHSVVFEMVQKGIITEEQARLSEQSNIITRALGLKENLEIDIAERPYKKGDRFMLCSDGIHGTMPEKELIAKATKRGDLGQTVDQLAHEVDEKGKAEGGQYDNLTLALVETKTRSELKEPMKYKTTIILGIIAVVLAVMALLLNSCKNKDVDVETFRIANEQVRSGIDTVGISGTYDFFTLARNMKINIGRDSTLADAQSHAVALAGKDYAVTVRNLQPNTTYYYDYSVNFGLANDFITPTKRFSTLEAPSYTVSVSASPEEGGTVSGSGSYTQGQQCTVMASANEGYAFLHWSENNNVVSTDSVYRFSVMSHRELVARFEAVVPEEYTIAVSASPSNGGSVSGGGVFQEGQSCTVRATANTGYTFVNWTENGNQVSANANYTFTVNGNRTLVANFTAGSYIISATVEPENSGTITGAGGYEYGQSCTLRATANTGYTFEKWTENGTQVSTNATYTFTVSGSRSFVAHFKVNSYTITVSANPPAGGVATGGGTFEYGQSCTLTATANSGYNFTNWTEGSNVVSSNASYTFTVTGNRTLKANFTQQAPQNYTISVSANPSEGGTVTGGGTYQQSQSCTVRATANSGYTFSKWTENGNQVSTSANYTFTVTGNRTLVAHFIANPQSYTITVTANPTNGGTVNGGGTYQQGQSCTVIAVPNRASSFSESWDYGLNGWTNIDADGDGHVWYHGSEAGNHNYAPIPSHSGEGHLMGESWCNALVQALCPDDYLVSPQRYDIGNSSALSFWACAQDVSYPAEHFGVAISMGSNTNSSDFTTIQEWTLTAKSIGSKTIGRDGRFTREGTWYQYSCNLSAYSGQQVWIAIRHFNCCDMAVMCLDDIELSSSSGFSFVNWTENGNVVSTNASYTFTVNSNRNLVANFTQQAPQSYHINVSANPSNGGSVSGGGTYQQGQSCTVHAAANNGYTFVNWTENGTQVSTNANYTFTVNSNRNLVANFQQQAPQTYTISVSADPSSGGSVSGGGTYQQGQNCTVIATANNGYSFTNWTENGNVVSTNASYSFTVTSNRTLVAHFTANPQSYTITVSANPTNGGTVSGGGTYQQGQNCTVTAIANSGFTFTNWTENGNQVSTNASYSFTVNGNRSLVANFIVSTPLQPPTGAIAGLFSVSATKQVWFSQGNLQYKASTNTWRFGENQYDFVGSATQGNVYEGGVKCNNANISPTYNGWIDLFGWGTSGWNSGAVCYQPWSTSATYSDYYPGGQYYNHLTGTYANADWGVYNSIQNGGNQSSVWRSLTIDEWDYLIYNRIDANNKKSLATVNNVQGAVYLPDNWVLPQGCSFNPSSQDYSVNIYSASQWQLMQAAGAIFLPAAGKRGGNSVVHIGERGYYWTSSYYDVDNASQAGMSTYGLHTGYGSRSLGHSVRLVQDY